MVCVTFFPLVWLFYRHRNCFISGRWSLPWHDVTAIRRVQLHVHFVSTTSTDKCTVWRCMYFFFFFSFFMFFCSFICYFLILVLILILILPSFIHSFFLSLLPSFLPSFSPSFLSSFQRINILFKSMNASFLRVDRCISCYCVK